MPHQRRFPGGTATRKEKEKMAYGRKKSTARSSSRKSRSTSGRRTTKRRTVSSRKNSGGSRRGNTLRIEIVQPAANPVARPVADTVVEKKPKRAKF